MLAPTARTTGNQKNISLRLLRYALQPAIGRSDSGGVTPRFSEISRDETGFV